VSWRKKRRWAIGKILKQEPRPLCWINWSRRCSRVAASCSCSLHHAQQLNLGTLLGVILPVLSIFYAPILDLSLQVSKWNCNCPTIGRLWRSWMPFLWGGCSSRKRWNLCIFLWWWDWSKFECLSRCGTLRNFWWLLYWKVRNFKGGARCRYRQ